MSLWPSDRWRPSRLEVEVGGVRAVVSDDQVNVGARNVRTLGRGEDVAREGKVSGLQLTGTRDSVPAAAERQAEPRAVEHPGRTSACRTAAGDKKQRDNEWGQGPS